MKKGAIALSLLATLTAASVVSAQTKADTYVYMGLPDPIPDLDPSQAYDTSSSHVLENTYERLVDYQPGEVAKFAPMLATEWKSSNNGRTWTFTLRKNVKFHSGNTFTCEDAEYTFERAMVQYNAESWSGTILGMALLGTKNNPADDKSITYARIDKAVECNSQGQLVFTLTQTDPTFIHKMAYGSAGILDKKFAVAGGEWNGTAAQFAQFAGKSMKQSYLQNNMSGTGAYRLVSKSPTQYVFRAFDGYWGGKPKIENVIVQGADEPTRILAIQRGDADRVLLSRPSLEQLRNAQGVKIMDDLGTNVQQAIFLNQNIKGTEALGSGKLDGNGIPANFFSDVNVRKGFAYAFNYKQFVDQALRGKGVIRSMVMPENYLGYDKSLPLPEFNLEKATAAFKKAWGGQVWENGFTVPMVYNTGNLARQAASEMLRDNLAKINPKFKVVVQVKPFGEINSAAAAGQLAIRNGGWAADYADPDNFLPVFLSSKGFYSPSLNFKDTTIENLLEQAARTNDNAKRESLYKLVGRRAAEITPLIILPTGTEFVVIRENLKGYDKPNLMLSGRALWKNLSK